MVLGSTQPRPTAVLTLRLHFSLLHMASGHGSDTSLLFLLPLCIARGGLVQGWGGVLGMCCVFSRHHGCMISSYDDAEKAFSRVLRWRGHGGGMAAQRALVEGGGFCVTMYTRGVSLRWLLGWVFWLAACMCGVSDDTREQRALFQGDLFCLMRWRQRIWPLAHVFCFSTLPGDRHAQHAT